jgi:hypothetical protein
MDKRIICRITGIGEKVIFAKTGDGKLVLMAKWFHGMAAAAYGDTVEFDPYPFVLKPGHIWKVKPTFWAMNPKIIAKGVLEAEPVARPRTDAVVWKQEQETRAEIDGLREVLTRAGDSGLGTARASESHGD